MARRVWARVEVRRVCGERGVESEGSRPRVSVFFV